VVLISIRPDIVLPTRGGKAATDWRRRGERVAFGSRTLEARLTPGHTKGCVTYVMDDASMAFTGDCVLLRGCGRTDFQDGDPGTFYLSVQERIFSLPDSCLLYPGHDYCGLTVTSVAEEMAYNPRLGRRLGESDFAGYMRNMKLAHSKKVDVAVPAKFALRQGEEGVVVMSDSDWAPLSCTFAGVWDVDPSWVEENTHAVTVLDVREPAEWDGPLGRIHSAVLIPLGELEERAHELPNDKPIVAVCRAGGRSAQATMILRDAGFERVANLPGGMLRWRAEGRATEGGS
jgi:sulfur dioxygenase